MTSQPNPVPQRLQAMVTRLPGLRLSEFSTVAFLMFDSHPDEAAALTGALRKELEARVARGEFEVLQHNKLTERRESPH